MYEYTLKFNEDNFLQFMSPVPLRRGEQIEVGVELYEIVMIRYEMASLRSPERKLKEIKTMYMVAILKEIN